MVRSRRSGRSTMPSQAHLCAALLAAAALLAFTAEDAFVAASKSWTSRASMPLRSAAAVTSSSSTQQPSVGSGSQAKTGPLLKVAASLALLCAASAASRRSRSSKASKVRCLAVVGNRSPAPEAVPRAAVASAPLVVEPLMDFEECSLVDFEGCVEPQMLPDLKQAPPQKLVSMLTSAPVAAQATAAAAAQADCRRGALAACFVGGVRQVRSSRQQKSRASRAAAASETAVHSAQRATGKRLCLAAQSPATPVAERAFDASLQRAKIQRGACLRLSRGREAKAMTFEGRAKSTGVLIELNVSREVKRMKTK
ncbi:unnamed protein product [Polarella glacialis]|uniref:Uncharacterized protein n=1 Tax=Polarella glacialis TaxID=89957 RepID=A0A813E3D6_POLGL|nr:unnamed protein product [Polarella glacialis]CAE8609330.1 unnamed protein product [Polarella glacialis]CAE8700803.1 unnamed protein product [Polarella glacialis]